MSDFITLEQVIEFVTEHKIPGAFVARAIVNVSDDPMVPVHVDTNIRADFCEPYRLPSGPFASCYDEEWG